MTPDGAVRVAVIPLVRTRSLARPLGYEAPAPLPIGAIVDAPLGSRVVAGVVVDDAPPDSPAKLRLVTDTGQRLAPDLVALAGQLAARYATTPARALELMLAPRATPRPLQWARATGTAPARGARQADILDQLAAGPVPLSALDADAAVLRRMQRRGLIVLEPPPPPRNPTATAPTLTADQEQACQRLLEAIDADGPTTLLLYGVTGSGKTEVYMRGVARCIEQQRAAIILVPEIALAPQTAARLSDRFGGRVAVWHSALSATSRASEYQRIRSGEATIIVGPRSAVFAPVERLGLIVVDEEHESAYKQESDPRYDARSVAALRARHHQAVLLVCSATPRPESWQLVPRVELPRRIGGRLPPVTLVDLRRDGNYPISTPLSDALGEISRSGGRAILLLNRRGEAPALHCRGCGAVPRCPDCDVAMTLHRARPGLHCHHCGRVQAVPARCPHCGALDLARIGAGTERLEAVLRERFPELVVLRLDADTTARRGALDTILERFAATDRAVLCGTQLVAKGHDFADVRIACAVDADAGLAQPDFRAEERTFALLVQLAGRAGREGSGGSVLVQAWDPDHRAIRLAARHAVPEFLAGELDRRRLLGYPPFRRLIRVMISAADAAAARRLLAPIAEKAAAALPDDVILGPAMLHRLRGRARCQMLVKCAHAQASARQLAALAADAAAQLRRAGATIMIDVDPQTL